MKRILIVDDDPNIRLLYKEVLCEGGFDVLEAESGQETFNILNKEGIDLVVLDIKLRFESGLEILQKISKQFPQIPVILCSAYLSFQDDFKSWLADSYLVKSTDPYELVREVDRILGLKVNRQVQIHNMNASA
ncbi:MAG: response regulator [Thermodesulfobacteriota bacterium]